MDIVLLRHGKTESNLKGYFAGSLDNELCREGREQIAGLKEVLHKVKFDCVYCSPLKRAIETAEILEVNYTTDDRLREMNFGLFEGLSYKEISNRYPIESDEWKKDFVNYRTPEGESLLDVYNRAKSFIEDIKGKHQKILVITHQGVIGSSLSLVFNKVDYYFKFRIDNGSLSTIAIEDGYMYIKALNGRTL